MLCPLFFDAITPVLLVSNSPNVLCGVTIIALSPIPRGRGFDSPGFLLGAYQVKIVFHHTQSSSYPMSFTVYTHCTSRGIGVSEPPLGLITV